MNNRFLVFTTFLIMWLLMVLGGSYVEAQPATAGSQRDWEKTLRAAEREGQVAVYTATRGGALRMEAFKKKYPKIKFVTVSITPAQVSQRVLAERRARKYLVDVVNTGADPNNQLFYPARDGSGADSMRIDIPKDPVIDVYRRREGAKYLFVGTPERTNMKPIYNVVKKALATAAKKK